MKGDDSTFYYDANGKGGELFTVCVWVCESFELMNCVVMTLMRRKLRAVGNVKPS